MRSRVLSDEVQGLVLEGLVLIGDSNEGSLSDRCHKATRKVMDTHDLIHISVYVAVVEGLFKALNQPKHPSKKSSSHCSHSARALTELEDRAPVLTVFTHQPRVSEQLFLAL